MGRERFSSRLGFILISAGCAIGLGNVWRFPYIVGQYGGAAFVLIYAAFLVLLGLPIIGISENFATQKVVNAERFIQKCGGSAADLKESAFFSDSMNDFPLLDHVARHGGKAVATNPDDRLRSTAQERHWEILELFSEHKLF